MDWNIELLYVIRVTIALICGAGIGFDRERRGMEAGIRTYAAVAIGSCTFGLISSHVPESSDFTRIASGVVTGIGFIGAGVIIHQRGKAIGLTTAATIWSTASVVLAIAFGMYILGILTSFIIYALLALNDFKWYQRMIQKGKKESATGSTTGNDH